MLTSKSQNDKKFEFFFLQGGLNDVQESGDFIVDTFISQSKVDQKRRPMYPHFTTATDTDLVKHVFSCVADVILNEVLKTTGLQ